MCDDWAMVGILPSDLSRRKGIEEESLHSNGG